MQLLVLLKVGITHTFGPGDASPSQQVEVEEDWPIFHEKKLPNGALKVKDPSNGRTFKVNGQ